MRIIIILCLICFNVHSQISIHYASFEEDNTIYNYPSFDFVDTTSLNKKRYQNNQLINQYYFNESTLKLDSLTRFFENGKVAFNIRVSHYSKFENEFGETYLPNYELSTYYKSGVKRSEERNFYLFHSRFFSKFFFDEKDGEKFYNEQYHFNKQQSGTVRTINNSINKLEIYENDILVEVWNLTGDFNIDNLLVSSVEKPLENKTVKKKWKVKKIMRRRNFRYFDRNIIVEIVDSVP